MAMAKGKLNETKSQAAISDALDLMNGGDEWQCKVNRNCAFQAFIF